MKKVGLWFYRNDGGAKILNTLVNELQKHGYDVISDFDMRKCYVLNGHVYTDNGYDLSSLDAFYHMNADEQNQFQNDILKVLSNSKVKVFNDYESFSNAKDKMMANAILCNSGINVPPALFVSENFDKDIMKKIFGEWKSVVLKPRRNHGGKGILKFDDYESFEDFCQATTGFYKDYYMEKFIPFGTHDYRVEIFDGKVISGYSRQRTHNFKTNISSGGKHIIIPTNEETKEIALRAANAIGVTTTIVDMIKSEEDNKYYVLEVNPIMGIFLESVMNSGERFPVPGHIDKTLRSDNAKINAIVNYFDKILSEQGD